MSVNNLNYIKRLKDKKEDALEFIVDEYMVIVKGTVYQVLSPIKDNNLIEECINDIFLSVWNNSQQFKGNDSIQFKKWIYAISKFKAIDYYRKAVRKEEFAVDNIDSLESNSAEEEVILREERSELLKLINTLEPVDRKIFTMKFLLGIKSEDIANKLKITKASVDNRIYRAKKKLRDKKIVLRMEGI